MITSPCIKLCQMDPRVARCAGCKRTLAEIAAWGGMSDAERQAVMDDLPRRVTSV